MCEIYVNPDIDTIFQIFINITIYIVDKYCPLKKTSWNKAGFKNLHWLTKTLKINITICYYRTLSNKLGFILMIYWKSIDRLLTVEYNWYIGPRMFPCGTPDLICNVFLCYYCFAVLLKINIFFLEILLNNSKKSRTTPVCQLLDSRVFVNMPPVLIKWNQCFAI